MQSSHNSAPSELLIPIQFREPQAAPYIWVNKDTNKVHLIMSAVGGTHLITTDNTCKTLANIKQSLGIHRGARALTSLTSYQSALMYDIRLIQQTDGKGQASGLLQKKQERLKQINFLLDMLGYIIYGQGQHGNQAMKAFLERDEQWPVFLQAALGAPNNNLFSMHLRPRDINPVTQMIHPVFAVSREDKLEDNPFYPFIKNISHILFKSATPEKTLLAAVKKQLSDGLENKEEEENLALFKRVKEAIQSQAVLLFGEGISLENVKAIAYEQILNLHLLEDGEVFTPEILFDVIIHASGLLQSLAVSPFSEVNKDSNPPSSRDLYLLVQFFLGNANIYCVANKLVASDINFGKMRGLSERLFETVAKAFSEGVPIEERLLDFIDAYCLRQQKLSPHQRAEIIQQFQERWRMIRDAHNFDEFMLLQGKGSFVAHQGSIGTGFVNLLGEQLKIEFKAHPRFADRYKDFCVFIDHTVADYQQVTQAQCVLEVDDPHAQASTVGMTEEALYAFIITLFNKSEDHSLLIDLLFSYVKGNIRVFQILPDRIKEQMKSNPQFNILYEAIGQRIENRDLIQIFNRIMGINTSFRITREMANALYIACITQQEPDEKYKRYQVNLQHMRALLTEIGVEIAGKNIFFNSENEIVLICSEQQASHLQVIINANLRKIYLNQTAIDSIQEYVWTIKDRQVNQRNVSLQAFVEICEQYRDVNQAGKRIIELLKLIAIHDVYLSRPNYDESENGYILTADSADSFEHILTILNYRLLDMPSSKARALYVLLEQHCPSYYEKHIEPLNNQDDAENSKIAQTLKALGLQFAKLSFKDDYNGYKIVASEEVGELIEEINELCKPVSHEKFNAVVPSRLQSRIDFLNSLRESVEERKEGESEKHEKSIPAPPGGPMGLPPLHLQLPPLQAGENEEEEEKKDEVSTALILGALAVKAQAPRLLFTMYPVKASCRGIDEASEPLPSYKDETAIIRLSQRGLEKFQAILKDHPILGTIFFNPYTGEIERFPESADELTARHLQIIARNESENMTGAIDASKYGDLFTIQQLASIRCLAEHTAITGYLVPTHTGGGYLHPREEIPQEKRRHTIMVDLCVTRWGEKNPYGLLGLVFFPMTEEIPPNYKQWQAEMYDVLYGESRPLQPSAKNKIPFFLGNMQGYIDLELLSKIMEGQFQLGWNATLFQAQNSLTEEEKVHFKFLMEAPRPELQHAQLNGILNALPNVVQKNQPIEKLSLVLNFEDPISLALVKSIEKQCQLIKPTLQVAHTMLSSQDALVFEEKGEDLVPAVTMMSHPHTFVGNTGRHTDVHSSMACNVPNIQQLNAGFNDKMLKIGGRDYTPSSSYVMPEPLPSAPGGPQFAI
ncbi:MAG: hypothetical protein K0S27_1058 [Gammaproteobacteria bacterium]|jgi:hypothetical protein|nr:hypothetical protein [Gammaproteobacteria bacterium]